MLRKKDILLIHPGVTTLITAHQGLLEEGVRLGTDHPKILPEEVDCREGAVRRVEDHPDANHLEVLLGEVHLGVVPLARRMVPK